MLETFHLDIEPEALNDIQNAIDYYDSKRRGLGKKFYEVLANHIELLRKNHLSFAINYDDIPVLPIKKFPYAIHYRVLSAQKTVSIKAVFCTHENPYKWRDRIE